MPGAPVAAVVFDLDGTLVDSAPEIVAAVTHALSAHGLPKRTHQEILGHVGDGADTLLVGVSGLTLGSAALTALRTSFLDFYTERSSTSTLMPGAAECLAALAPLPLALATNKPRRSTLAVLRALRLECFRVVCCGVDARARKPAPDALLHVARELAVAPSELVMVGDGPQDVLAARAAGARSIGVLGGIAPEAALRESAPDQLIPSLVELPELILELMAARDRGARD